MFLSDVKSISRYRVLQPPSATGAMADSHETGGMTSIGTMGTPGMPPHSLFSPASTGYTPLSANSSAITTRYDLSPGSSMQSIAHRASGGPVGHPSSMAPTTTPPSASISLAHRQASGLPPLPPTSTAAMAAAAAPVPPLPPNNHLPHAAHVTSPPPPQPPQPQPQVGNPSTGVGVNGSGSGSGANSANTSQQLASSMQHTKQLMAALSSVQMQSQQQQAQHLQSQQQVTQLQLQLQIQMQLSQQLQAQLQLQQQQLAAGNSQLANNSAPFSHHPQAHHHSPQPPTINHPMTMPPPAPYMPYTPISPTMTTKSLGAYPPMPPMSAPHQPGMPLDPLTTSFEPMRQSTAAQQNASNAVPQQTQHQQQIDTQTMAGQQTSQAQSTPPLPITMTTHHLPTLTTASASAPPPLLSHPPVVADGAAGPAPYDSSSSAPAPMTSPAVASVAATTTDLKAEVVSVAPPSVVSPPAATAANVSKKRDRSEDGASLADESETGDGDHDLHDPDEPDPDHDGDSSDNSDKEGEEVDDGPPELDADGNPLPKKKRIAGSSCHQCKTRRVGDELIYCGMSHAKKGRAKKRKAERKCRKKYCPSREKAAPVARRERNESGGIESAGAHVRSVRVGCCFCCVGNRCLLKFYNESAPPKPAPGEPNKWSCPGCRGLCTCAACKRTQARRENKRKKLAMQQAHGGGHPHLYGMGMPGMGMGMPGMPPMPYDSLSMQQQIQQLQQMQHQGQMPYMPPPPSSGPSHSSPALLEMLAQQGGMSAINGGSMPPMTSAMSMPPMPPHQPYSAQMNQPPPQQQPYNTSPSSYTHTLPPPQLGSPSSGLPHSMYSQQHPQLSSMPPTNAPYNSYLHSQGPPPPPPPSSNTYPSPGYSNHMLSPPGMGYRTIAPMTGFAQTPTLGTHTIMHPNSYKLSPQPYGRTLGDMSGTPPMTHPSLMHQTGAHHHTQQAQQHHHHQQQTHQQQVGGQADMHPGVPGHTRADLL